MHNMDIISTHKSGIHTHTSRSTEPIPHTPHTPHQWPLQGFKWRADSGRFDAAVFFSHRHGPPTPHAPLYSALLDFSPPSYLQAPPCPSGWGMPKDFGVTGVWTMNVSTMNYFSSSKSQISNLKSSRCLLQRTPPPMICCFFFLLLLRIKNAPSNTSANRCRRSFVRARKQDGRVTERQPGREHQRKRETLVVGTE